MLIKHIFVIKNIHSYSTHSRVVNFALNIQCLPPRQSLVSSCQIRSIFAWQHASKIIKGRYGYIDKYLNFANFEIIQQKNI